MLCNHIHLLLILIGNRNFFGVRTVVLENWVKSLHFWLGRRGGK